MGDIKMKPLSCCTEVTQSNRFIMSMTTVTQMTSSSFLTLKRPHLTLSSENYFYRKLLLITGLHSYILVGTAKIMQKALKVLQRNQILVDMSYFTMKNYIMRKRIFLEIIKCTHKVANFNDDTQLLTSQFSVEIKFSKGYEF